MSFESAKQKVADKSTIRANHAFFVTKQNEPKTNPTNENNNQEVNLQFGNIPIYPPKENNSSPKDATATCPLKTTPRACPFGGACHTCPTKIQTKLTINQPGDIYEQEADKVAEQVMRMPDPAISSKLCSTSDDTINLQRKCIECEEEEKLQRKETGTKSGVAPSIVQEVLSSPGQPLDATTSAFFEPRFRQAILVKYACTPISKRLNLRQL